MKALARVGKSRDAWKRKAIVRGNKCRYLKRQLDASRARARLLQEQLRALEAERASTPATARAVSDTPVILADAAEVRTLCVLLVIQAVVSFRSVPRILMLARPDSWVPHFTSAINWTLRVGLAALQAVAPSTAPWIAVVDTSIDIGLSKLLVVLRIPLDALALRGSAIALGDCEVVGLKIRSTWTGETIAETLGEVFTKAGTPRAILKDAGRDLAKGTRLWRESSDRPEVLDIDDVGHAAARALEEEFAETKELQSFLEYVKAAAKKLWQSDVAFLSPPRPRSKGRFQSISRLARWAKRLRPLLGGPGAVDETTLAGRLRRLAGGLTPHRAFLDRFVTACDVVERCLEITKNRGLNAASYGEVCVELARLPKTNRVRQRLEQWARDQLRVQSQLGLEQTPLVVSSDIIESLFGKLKVILARNPKAEFNRLSLVVPCLCGARSAADVTAALHTVSHRDLERWELTHVPPTQRRARTSFNRGELRPDWVPKSAQSRAEPGLRISTA